MVNINKEDSIMNEAKITNVLNFLNEYAKVQYKQGKRKTRELFPEFILVSKKCNLTMDDVKEIIYILEKRGDIIRFTSQRYLKWVWEKINQKIEESKSEMKAEVKPIIKERSSFNLSLLIIKTMITIPALIAAIMSIHYTNIWFLNYLNPFLALSSSIAIVLSNIGAFESIFLFGKKKQVLQIILAIIVFLVTCSFSMGTTLAGQLNNEIKSKKLSINKNSINSNNRLLVFTYKEKINNLNNDLLRLRKEYDHNIKQKEKYTENYNADILNENNKQYWKFNYLAHLRKEEIKKLKIEVKEYEIKLENLLNKKVVIQEVKEINIFSWLHDLFKIKPDLTKFILYMIPAIFYDIISPFFFAIIFFYKMEEK